MKGNLIQRYLGWGLTIAAVIAILYYFSDIVVWIILAYILSLVCSPIMHLLGKIRIGKWRMGSTLKAAITLLVFFGVLSLFVMMFVPLIVQQGQNLASVNYAKVMDGLEEPINHFYGRLSGWGLVEAVPEARDSTEVLDSLQAQDSLGRLDPVVQDSLHTGLDSLTNDSVKVNLHLKDGPTLVTTTTVEIDSLIKASGDTVTRTNIQLNIKLDPSIFMPKDTIGEEILDSTAIVKPTDTPIERIQKQAFTYVNPTNLLSRIASTLFDWLGNLFVLITSVAFIAFFFLQEDRLFSRVLKAPFPEEYYDEVDKTLYLIRKMLIRYFEGIIGQVTIITLYLWLLLWLVGAPNAFLIAFFAGFINIIPYLGPVFGMAFGVIVCVCSNLDLDFYNYTIPLIIRVVIVFLSMQALDSFLLQPLIFSKSVKAHPLEIFIVIIIGSKLGGIVGMIAAIPAYTVLRVIASVFLSRYKLVQSLTEQLGIKSSWFQGSDADAPPPDEKKASGDDVMDDGWK